MLDDSNRGREGGRGGDFIKIQVCVCLVDVILNQSHKELYTLTKKKKKNKKLN